MKYVCAFYFNTEALKISNTLKDTIGIAFAYFNIASVHFSKKDYKKAIDNYYIAKNIFSKQKLNTEIYNMSVCSWNNVIFCFESWRVGACPVLVKVDITITLIWMLLMCDCM